jgi:hypothetical protein
MIDRTHPSGLSPDPNEPRFSREELDSIKFDDAELDAEEVKRDAELRRLGFSDSEISRVRGGRAVPTPEPTLADVEAELAEIDKFRREQKIKYFKSDATQKREVELLEARARLKAAERGEGEASGKDGKADGLEGNLPESLRREWEKSGPNGLEDALRAVRFRTTMLDDLEDGGEGLRASFDRELPEEVQGAIASGLANDQEYSATATPAEVQEFGELEHGAMVLKEWGPQAPRLLARARREADAIVSRLNERSKIQLHNWAMSRSAAERGAIIKALAARATRRL